MIADSNIINPQTGEVIAQTGRELDDEILYRMEHIGADMQKCEFFGQAVPIENNCDCCLVAAECYTAWEKQLDEVPDAIPV